jgi:hypothetical protein
MFRTSNLWLCEPARVSVVSPEVIDPGVLLPDRAPCDENETFQPRTTRLIGVR